MTVTLVLALLLSVDPAVPAAPSDDPYVWLEEFDSPRAMEWVRSHNAPTVKALEGDPRYKTLYEQSLAIAGAKDRIPTPTLLHGEIFNFWQDADHLRGLWRKTTLKDYRALEPQWKPVLDLDALNKAEGKSWVLRGRDCLEPEETRCLISLSDGGEDAVIVREFDLDTNAFVEGGFTLPRGKHRVAWEDKDTLLVATDWKPGELTTSGYPYITKRVKRGQPLSSAVEIFRGTKKDGGYGVSPTVSHDGAGNVLVIIERPLDTFTHELYVVDGVKAKKLNLPPKVSIAELVAGRVIFKLDEAWGKLATGSVAMTELAATKKNPGALAPTLVWAPGPKQSIESLVATKDKLLVTYLDMVQGRVSCSSPPRAAGRASRSSSRRTRPSRWCPRA